MHRTDRPSGPKEIRTQWLVLPTYSKLRPYPQTGGKLKVKERKNCTGQDLFFFRRHFPVKSCQFLITQTWRLIVKTPGFWLNSKFLKEDWQHVLVYCPCLMMAQYLACCTTFPLISKCQYAFKTGKMPLYHCLLSAPCHLDPLKPSFIWPWDYMRLTAMNGLFS